MLSLKKLKKAIKKDISQRDFFLSPVFKNHFTGIIKMVSSRYNTDSIYMATEWNPENEDIAYTDNRKIFINFDNSLLKNEMLEMRYLMSLGLLGHELGHVLYTDFNDNVSWLDALIKGSFYGKYDNKFQNSVDDFLKYMSTMKFYMFASEIHANIANCIEDRYVNDAICKEFTGTFKSGIKTLHAKQFAEDITLLPDEISNIINGVFRICIKNTVNDTFKSRYPELIEAEKILQNITSTHNPDDRFGLCNDVFLLFWPRIKQYAEQNKQKASSCGQGDDSPQQGQQGSQGQSGNSSSISGDFTGAKESSQMGRGTGMLVKQNKEGNSTDSDSSNKSSNNHKEEKSEDKNSEHKSKEESNSGSEKDSNAENDKNDSNESGNKSNNTSDSCDNLQGSDSDSGKNGAKTEVSADVTFDGQSCDEKIDINTIEKVIDGLLSKITQNLIRNDPERAERILANTLAKEVTEGKNSPHSGVKFQINTVRDAGDRYKYESAARRLSGVSKRLQKRVLDVLDETADGGVCKNLLKGNKINPAASANNNGRIFKRNNLPDRPELAVCVLIDQSGSMYGTRIEKALEMAIIIEDFCSALNIPLQISGHCDSCNVQIYDYIRFEDYDKNRKYRLTNIFSSGCNRDGLALKYCEKNILEREEENKLLIIISDGRPNSYGYCGAAAEKDLSEIKNHFEKSGGRLVAAAIGDDKETIKRIYKDSFVDITDLNQLPIKMVKIISSYFN